MSKRLLSWILAVLLVMPAVVSCSDNTTETENSPTDVNTQSNQTETEPIVEETDPALVDELPERDWDGFEFMIYNNNVLTNTWFLMNYINFEEDSADPLESAVYRRNALVEERFDINILETISESDSIREVCIAGLNEFELILINGTTTLSLAQDGYLYDQLKLPYIDLTKAYWDQNVVEFLTIADKLYYTAGNFATTHHDGVKTFFFNKGLIESYQLESPYNFVHEGTWTLDNFGSLLTHTTSDLNGDGAYTEVDRYGLLSQSGSLYPALILGTGEVYIEEDENGEPALAFYNERFIRAFEKIIEVCHAEGDTVTFDARGGKNSTDLGDRVQEIMFPNNQALFWCENLAWSKALREMEFDFGIVPSPKLDESQDRYYNITSGNFYGTAIPVCTSDVERTSIVLEALNSMSGDLITAYYDVTLESKLARDAESGEMLDIIFSNLIYDLAWNCGLANCSGSIADMLAAGNADISSYYSRSEKTMNKLIQKSYEKIFAVDH